jgi:hypothetical protein
MRTLMVTIAAAFFSLSVAAHNPGVDPANYCVKTKNGKTIVEYNGTAITKEITFKDGTKIKPNGTVLLATGKTVKLKEGECVNENTVMDLSKRRNEKIGDQKEWESEKIPMDKETEEYPEMKTDSTKTDETLDPDRFKNDQSNPQKGEKDKDSDELPPKMEMQRFRHTGALHILFVFF